MLENNKIELRYVRSFLVIAEELHFGHAAVRLHLAQPSLSQQLQRLAGRPRAWSPRGSSIPSRRSACTRCGGPTRGPRSPSS